MSLPHSRSPYGVLLDPLPFGRPDRLVSVGLWSTELRRVQQPLAGNGWKMIDAWRAN